MIVDSNMFKNKYSKMILGAVWGFGLAVICRTACHGRNCIIYKAPNPDKIKQNIYEYKEKCYQYTIVNTKCNENPIV